MWTHLIGSVLAIIIAGFVSGVRLPGNIPIGLAALLLGTAIGWIGGYMHALDVAKAADDISAGLPSLNIDRLGDGLGEICPCSRPRFRSVSQLHRGDVERRERGCCRRCGYNLRSAPRGRHRAVAGAALGSPFSPAVYIGQPGWKEAGGRTSYSLATGIVTRLLLFGLSRCRGGAPRCRRSCQFCCTSDW
jgi:AGZA family xanthine/uracil permease-like MFS transporter